MMKKMFVFVILIGLALSTIFSDQEKGVKYTVTSYYQNIEIDFENQWAFIIAINEYNYLSRLRYPVKEAQQIEALLKNKYGYLPKKIKSLLDNKATHSAIMNQLKWYVRHLTDKDNLFIYFSGHGYKDDVLKKGFWMPCDAGSDKQAIRDEKEKTKETLLKISNHDIVDVLRECKARHIFVVADSCFSAQFFASQHKVIRVPETHYKLKSRQLLASGRELVGDGDFGKYFVRCLESNEEPYLLASDLISNVRTTVINNTDLEPEGKPVRNTGDEGGEFILVRRLASLKQLEYKPNLPTDPTDIDVTGLKAEAERKRLQREKEKADWQNWQREFQKEIENQQKIDNGKTISFTSKRKSWESISSKYKKDNPYTSEDEELRKFVNERIEYWTAKEKEEIEWTNWQKKFEQNVEKLKGIEKDPDISPKSKKDKWLELLKEYRNNNPYSDEDENLRAYVKERISFLKREIREAKDKENKNTVTREMKKRSAQIHGKEIVVSDKATLMAALPIINGWTMEEPEYEKGSFAQLKTSQISTTYTGPYSKKIEVRITDTASASVALQPWRIILQMNLARDDEQGYQKITTVNNIPVIERYDKKSQEASLGFIVKDRYMVELESRGKDCMPLLKNLVPKLHLSKLY